MTSEKEGNRDDAGTGKSSADSEQDQSRPRRLMLLGPVTRALRPELTMEGAGDLDKDTDRVGGFKNKSSKCRLSTWCVTAAVLTRCLQNPLHSQFCDVSTVHTPQTRKLRHRAGFRAGKPAAEPGLPHVTGHRGGSAQVSE